MTYENRHDAIAMEIVICGLLNYSFNKALPATQKVLLDSRWNKQAWILDIIRICYVVQWNGLNGFNS